MKLYDTNTQDLAQAVQDVLEGKAKNECTSEKDFKPHMMYDPKTGKGYKANTYDDHVRMDKMGYTHEKPEENVAGPADLSVDQNMKKVKDKHGPVNKVDKTGLKEEIDAAHEEALAIEEARKVEAKHDDEEEGDEEPPTEDSDKQKKYKAFFDKALKKFGVDSPAELKGDKKKEFFDYVDANYEADNESD